MAISRVRDAEAAAMIAVIPLSPRHPSLNSPKHWKLSMSDYVSSCLTRRVVDALCLCPVRLTISAVQAENALAVQQNAPAHPPPILPSDAFEPESLASWSHSLGNFHSLGEENLALASNDSHAAGLPTAGLDFNDPAAYTLPLVPPFQRSGEPLPPTDASFSTSSTAAIAPFGINTSNGGWSDQLGVASQSSSSLSSGGMNKDWSSSGISSRITTPGTSIAQTDALERLPYNVGNDLCCPPTPILKISSEWLTIGADSRPTLKRCTITFL